MFGVYPIDGFTLIALVIIPFILGLLYGANVMQKRMMLRMIRKLPAEALNSLLEKNGEKNDDRKSVTRGLRCDSTKT